MEFFKQRTQIDFMGIRWYTAIISLILFAVSIGALATKGLNFGLDFTGGIQIEVKYQQAADLNLIRAQLTKIGVNATVQNYGASESVLISTQLADNISDSAMVDKILKVLPGAEKRRVDFVGPQVGKELATKGFLAILIAMLGTMIYIAMRFEYRFAVSSTLALIHDPVLILGIFALYQIEFDLKALAALLAVIGYSLNDTIVVFDRVRENFRKMRKATPIEIMNASINQTLSRTIMTSALTLMVVVALFVYGGEMIHGFALALMIGIIVGTYSSIYVAGALAIAMGLSRKDLLTETKELFDNRP